MEKTLVHDMVSCFLAAQKSMSFIPSEIPDYGMMTMALDNTRIEIEKVTGKKINTLIEEYEKIVI